MEGKAYFKNLDALRFFAALAVMLSHIAPRLHSTTDADSVFYKFLRVGLSFDGYGGDAGVSFFFVLSGFLITYLMLEESDNTGSFNVGHFYLRRILRIWPLYYLTLFIGFVIYPIVTTVNGFHEKASWIMYSFFLTNLDHIYLGWPQTGILGVQWSVAIEEQFYLVWPLLFVAVMRRPQAFPYITAICFIFSVVLRAIGFHKYHTFTALEDLALGALFAHFSRYHLNVISAFLSKLSRTAIVIIYVIGFAFIVFNFQLNKHIAWYGLIDRPLNSVFFMFIILEQNFSPNSVFKAGNVRLFNWLGKVSYGLYSLHMIAVYLVFYAGELYGLHPLIELMLSLLVAVLMSYASFNYFEKIFLHLKKRFDPKERFHVSVVA
jgi:peptidoglycan/LPS O-acetylase OafA/YrhL